ncbi:hypothetical protein HDF12_000218 [Edaphobacter lichenicola]|uniref:Uncharacterized protein n=1 Tax=Tunturiibacter lichenicola TaxID=2051959 RepID=A0A7Y9NJC2_9BACT|nr:hypothetical protein [Edaphobacter lichenicola]
MRKVSFIYLTGSGWAEDALGFGFGSEMRGSLHCALHDETVKRFGRDDFVWMGDEGEATANTGILRCAQDDDCLRGERSEEARLFAGPQ